MRFEMPGAPAPERPDEKDIEAGRTLRRRKPVTAWGKEHLWYSEQEEELLDEYDHEVLNIGLSALRQKLKETPPEGLPDSILLPDTAARPLTYALKPVFREAYGQAGLKEPAYRFVVTHSGPKMGHGLVDEDLGSEAWRTEVERRERARLDSKKKGADSFEIEEIERERLKTDEAVESIEKAWLAAADRIREIAKEAGRVGKQEVRFLVVDGFVSEGVSFMTIEKIVEAINADENQLPKIRCEYFTFHDAVFYDDQGNNRHGGPSPRKALAGRYIAATDRETPAIKAMRWSYPGFAYRRGYASQEDEREMLQRGKDAVTGVEKKLGDKYAKRAESRYPASMELLRDMMAEIGEEAVRRKHDSEK